MAFLYLLNAMVEFILFSLKTPYFEAFMAVLPFLLGELYIILKCTEHKTKSIAL